MLLNAVWLCYNMITIFYVSFEETFLDKVSKVIENIGTAYYIIIVREQFLRS